MKTLARNQNSWARFVAVLAATLLAACGGGGDSGGGSAPATVTPLSVSSTSPASGAAGVATNSAVSVTFNTSLQPATITAPGSFTLRETVSGNHVAGTVILDATGRIATFTPNSVLAANTQYTGSISTAVRNGDGSTLSGPHNWSFTTGAPAVVFLNPADTSTGLAINSKIIATFNTEMDAATLASPATTFTVRNTATSAAVVGTVTYDARSRTAIFTPSANLSPATNYTAIITTAARDARGSALGTAASWTFTTGAIGDTTRPTVTEFSPGHEVKDVELNSAIIVRFSEGVDPATVTPTTFFVSDSNSIHLSGRLVFDPATNTASFFPENMTANTRYHMVVTTDVRDLSSNPLGNGVDSFVSFFETGTR